MKGDSNRFLARNDGCREGKAVEVQQISDYWDLQNFPQPLRFFLKKVKNNLPIYLQNNTDACWHGDVKKAGSTGINWCFN